MNAPLGMTQVVRRVDLTDPRERGRVEDYVRENRGSLFHRPAWLIAVEQGTGQRAGGFVTEQLGIITGWLPLTEARSILFGNCLVSSGFGVGGGILSDGPETARLLADAAQAHAEQNGFAGVEVRGGAIPGGWRSWDDKHCGFERVLMDDDEAELLAIPRKARAEVRKGLKNSLEVRVGNTSEDLAVHYRVYSESVLNLGTPVFPKALFKSMALEFADDCDVLTIFKDGTPLASVMSFYHDGAVLPFWGGGSFAARGARANELMYYELMLHARRKGMKRFDFGRSKTGSGPCKFKKNWGFDPVPLVYGEWTAPGSPARDVDPTSQSYSRKIELWKKLPLPIANLVGPYIARDLA